MKTKRTLAVFLILLMAVFVPAEAYAASTIVDETDKSEIKSCGQGSKKEPAEGLCQMESKCQRRGSEPKFPGSLGKKEAAPLKHQSFKGIYKKHKTVIERAAYLYL